MKGEEQKQKGWRQSRKKNRKDGGGVERYRTKIGGVGRYRRKTNIYHIFI